MWKQFPEGQWFWPLQFAGWFLIGVGALMPTVMLLHDPVASLYFVGVRTLIGFGLTMVLRHGYRWVREWGGAGWRRAGLVLGCWGLCIILDYGLAKMTLDKYLRDMGTLGELTYYPRGAAFLVWTVLYFAICHWRTNLRERYRVLQLEAENQRAELQLLRAQINPHFLFNALNSVVAEKQDPAKVEAITLALSDHLHFSLRQAGAAVPLGMELEALNNYLAVEKVRFEERFEFEIVADAAVRQVALPSALIQPLVENAVKYGQQTSPLPLRIRITAVLEPETVLVEVSNTGKWVDDPDRRGTGIGLANLKRRLQLIFGAGAQLEHEMKPGCVCGRLRLPRPTAKEGK